MHRLSEGAERHLDIRYDVLDHGYVELFDYMGNDTRIAEAARQSTTGDTKGAEKDRKLIRYMLNCEHRPHTSPFEMVETTWKLRMPIFVARQWVRHRTCGMNEYSGRYSVMPDDAYVPGFDRLEICGQDKVNRQGSVPKEMIDSDMAIVQSVMEEEQEDAFEQYHVWLEDFKMSKEISRINLPLSTYTTWIWKMDLHNLFHFLWLRLDEHAQWEIRQYANIMWKIVQDGWPIAAEAFRDFKLEAKTLSKMQIDDLLKAAKEDRWADLANMTEEYLG